MRKPSESVLGWGADLIPTQPKCCHIAPTIPAGLLRETPQEATLAPPDCDFQVPGYSDRWEGRGQAALQFWPYRTGAL